LYTLFHTSSSFKPPHKMASSTAYFDDDPETPDTPPPMSPSALPQAEVPEVSLVEEEATTGVTFTPEYVWQHAVLTTALTNTGYGCNEGNGHCPSYAKSESDR